MKIDKFDDSAPEDTPKREQKEVVDLPSQADRVDFWINPGDGGPHGGVGAMEPTEISLYFPGGALVMLTIEEARAVRECLNKAVPVMEEMNRDLVANHGVDRKLIEGEGPYPEDETLKRGKK